MRIYKCSNIFVSQFCLLIWHILERIQRIKALSVFSVFELFKLTMNVIDMIVFGGIPASSVVSRSQLIEGNLI